MNIFVMVLVFLFMAGYYLIDSPGQRIAEHELEQSINRSDLRSVAECAASAHTGAVRNSDFQDICVKQYEIVSNFICLNEKQEIMKCDVIKKKKPAYSFIITSTGKIPDENFNKMLEIIEKQYKKSGTFGIFMNDFVLSGSNGKREIPKGIIKAANLSDGQLVYITQYDIPDPETEFETTVAADINCSVGTIKAYRFGKWQCVSANDKTTCNGDKIWDDDLQQCIADNSRKPLCASKQTAVMVDDVWECLDPISDKSCPTGTISKLNYNNLEWECVEDPSTTETTKKCTQVQQVAIYGKLGSTIRLSPSRCTDCEKMITDSDTCVSTCVPDTTKLSDPKCYQNADLCTGYNKAFYFGFPNSGYVANVSAVSGHIVPFDISHSQNRKFNCLDCGTGSIDTSKSFSPYIAICE